jgi:hypothetical protein
MKPRRSLSGTISVVAITQPLWHPVRPRSSCSGLIRFMDGNYLGAVAAKNAIERCGTVTTTGKRPRNLESAADV